jgi:hypothetical protein
MAGGTGGTTPVYRRAARPPSLRGSISDFDDAAGFHDILFDRPRPVDQIIFVFGTPEGARIVEIDAIVPEPAGATVFPAAGTPAPPPTPPPDTAVRTHATHVAAQVIAEVPHTRHLPRGAEVVAEGQKRVPASRRRR